MDELLIASNLALWAGLILLAVLVYALARQVGALFARIAPAGALMVNEVLKSGDPAPEITAEALNGAALTLGGEPESGAWPRATLIFFLAPDCPVCKTLLPVLRSVAKSESWVDIVLASDGGSAAEHQAYVAEQGIGEFPYVLSEGLGRSYGVGKLPYAVLIDERGRIASLGLVNSREHLESLFEAKERQAPSIQHYLQHYEAEVPAGGTHT
ncbi:MAG: redoxin domain-containing protein [Gammaproteobacteria bacterium]|nr:redoxin domain-containing protein [Gammaproteobacteria bacterium]